MYFQINTRYWTKILKDAIVIRQTPFDSSVQKGLQSYNLDLAEIYFPYQMFVTYSEADKSHSIYSKAKKIVLSDEMQIEDFCNYTKCDRSKIVVGGSPQLDLIISSRVNMEKRVIRIGFAPHHSLENSNHLSFGNFSEMSQAVVKIADQLNVEILVRPHPIFNLVGATNEERNFSILEFRKQVNSRNNIFFDENIDSSQFFGEIDLLITDGVSFLGEFAVTRKPLVFWPNKNHSPFSKFGKFFHDRVTIVTSSEQFLKEVTDIVISSKLENDRMDLSQLKFLGKTAENFVLILDDFS